MGSRDAGGALDSSCVAAVSSIAVKGLGLGEVLRRRWLRLLLRRRETPALSVGRLCSGAGTSAGFAVADLSLAPRPPRRFEKGQIIVG